MTRINLTHPNTLSNTHLVAEWNEAPRCITRCEARLSTGNSSALPPRYTLGRGHESFFYDKLLFIGERLTLIHDEMRARGMRPDMLLLAKHHARILALPSHVQQDFVATDDELWLSRARLYKRDPEHYRDWHDTLHSGMYPAALVEVLSVD